MLGEGGSGSGRGKDLAPAPPLAQTEGGDSWDISCSTSEEALSSQLDEETDSEGTAR